MRKAEAEADVEVEVEVKAEEGDFNFPKFWGRVSESKVKNGLVQDACSANLSPLVEDSCSSTQTFAESLYSANA